MPELKPHTIETDDPIPSGGMIATVHPASRDAVGLMMTSPFGDDGRSEWAWMRLANGDLFFGCFPMGDTYMIVSEGDADYRGPLPKTPEPHNPSPPYIVDGRESDDSDAAWQADGEVAPFVVFDSAAQVTLDVSYDTRAEAQSIADELTRLWLAERGWRYDAPALEWRKNDNGAGYDAVANDLAGAVAWECVHGGKGQDGNMPQAQGPEGNGHDLPTCRACGHPGTDEHTECGNCADAGEVTHG